MYPFATEGKGESRVYSILGSMGLREIQKGQFDEYKRFKQEYTYPSLINLRTDLDARKAKKVNSQKSSKKIKFKVRDHARFLVDACPEAFDAPA